MGGQEYGIGWSSTTGDDFIITNNTVRNPYISADAYELGFFGNPTNVTITGNKYYQDDSVLGDSGLVVDMYDDGQALIANNYIDNAQCIGIFILGGDGHTVKNNYLKDVGDTGCLSGAAGYYGVLIVSTSWNGDDRSASNHVFSYNIFDHTYRSFTVRENIAGVPPGGHKFYNNTMYDTGPYGVRAESPHPLIEVKNNIILNSYAASPTNFNYIYLSADFDLADITLDNNIYWYSSAFGKFTTGGASYATLDLWQAALDGDPTCDSAGNDCSSLDADPLLTGTKNFRLLAGSPAIGAGTDLSLTPDYKNNTVLNPPAIGAIEYYKLSERHIVGGINVF